MKAAPKEDLEKASSSCEAWVVCFGVLVVVAVLAEFGIAIYHPAYDSPLDRWGSAFADLFIGIGVAGEVALSMWNNTLQGELRERSNKRVEEATDRLADVEVSNAFWAVRAEEAAERAAKAELETEQLKAQFAFRRISQQQSDQLVTALRPLVAGVKVRIEYERVDPEAFIYSRDIVRVFLLAGAKEISSIGNSWTVSGDPVFGSVLGNWPEFDAASYLKIFADAGVPLATKEGVRRPYDPPRLPDLYIFVGTKPPPMAPSI
jgi:hypothetical protein